jgi:hypothetical protein
VFRKSTDNIKKVKTSDTAKVYGCPIVMKWNKVLSQVEIKIKEYAKKRMKKSVNFPPQKI